MTEIVPGLNRDWAYDVAAYGDGTAPTAWTPVRGVMENTPPVKEKNLEDDSSNDGEGYGSQIATGLNWSSELKVKCPQGTTTDPGQEILKTAGGELGEAGLVFLRCYDRRGGEAVSGVADASFVYDGGSTTDLKTATINLAGRGKIEPITNPGTLVDAVAKAKRTGGGITGVQLIVGGTGYVQGVSTVAFTGGAGTGATATLTIENGAVVDIDLTAPGTGYTSAPAVVFTR